MLVQTYHDYSNGKAHLPLSQIKAEVPQGDFVWSGSFWMIRSRGGFIAASARQIDDSMRLCPTCRRPLIWCTCETVNVLQQIIATFPTTITEDDYDNTIADFEMAARGM